jgi:membrane-associated phospholipid phosphatase
MRLPRLLLLLLFLPALLPAQAVYQLGAADAIGLGLGIGGGVGVTILAQNTPSYPGSLPLDPAQVNGFDRFVTGRWSPGWRNASDIGAGLAIGGNLFCLISRPVRREFLPIAVMAVETSSWLYSLGTLTKATVLRPRPFLYGSAAPLDEQLKADARFSFFSMHTCFTAGASFFTAKILHDLHPDARWRKWVWAGAAALPLGIGAMRIAAGKHFPTDVLVGYAVGAGIGCLVPQLHRRRDRPQSLRVYPHGQGIGLVWAF